MSFNLLLSNLPRKAGISSFPGLEQVDLTFGQVLHDPGERIEHVYFPTGSLVSLVSHQKGQIAVEVGVIGRDGMVGVAVALGENISSVRAVVQSAGVSMRAKSADFLKAFERRAGMRSKVHRYSNDLANQVMQTVSCNRNHNPEQRLARWLLMMRDRLSTDQYEFTQKYLGYMLGVRRAGVSEAAGRLQRRKLIRYTRGRIEIVNARGLKAACCSCYSVWKDTPRTH